MTEQSGRAWFLRCGAEDVGELAVLVGDRGRVTAVAEILAEPVLLNTDRGLTTVTGRYAGQRVTVAAFGMGAPAAALVLEELAMLGVRRFLRLGTALAVGGTGLGDLVLADGAIRNESTSASYAPAAFPAVPDPVLYAAVRARLRDTPRRWVSGLFASQDGFYTEMVAARPERAAAVSAHLAELVRYGVRAMDMETSAVLVAARVLGVRAASLCLASVTAPERRRMDGTERADAELALMRTGLDALTVPG
ncbi:nucleoside phosphorylase [Amycolatopsis cihanbeyliensis]|uniref:Uridine phosphorylase n=1 Tax=Amycolatopsis cihanbeyliensis TaxID=1128664 RepID=A0A542DCY0_AMYCI|nr:nucleoside phosphorylase [Amycolatopsis cihanbeyliensis]TQJ00929.1 uridine phosphorylase [Amycolatopsis cihanbeyliensis]